MKKQITINFNYSPEELALMTREYLRTPKETFGFFVRIGKILLVPFLFMLIWYACIILFSLPWTRGSVSVWHFLFLDQMRMIPEIYFLFILSIIIITVLLSNLTSLNVTEESRKFLQAPRKIDITATHIHEQTIYSEYWIMLDQIDRIKSGIHSYYLFEKGSDHLTVIPKSQLAEYEKHQIMALVEELNHPPLPDIASDARESNLLPEPVGANLKISNFRAPFCSIKMIFDKLTHWSLLDANIKVLLYYVVFFAIFARVSDVASVQNGSTTSSFNFISGLIAGTSVLLIMVIYQFLHCRVKNKGKPKEQKYPDLIIDELGVVTICPKRIYSFYWSLITNILQTGYGYYFVMRQANGSFMIPKEILTGAEKTDLLRIINSIKTNHPEIKISKNLL